MPTVLVYICNHCVCDLSVTYHYRHTCVMRWSSARARPASGSAERCRPWRCSRDEPFADLVGGGACGDLVAGCALLLCEACGSSTSDPEASELSLELHKIFDRRPELAFRLAWSAAVEMNRRRGTKGLECATVAPQPRSVWCLLS